MSTTLQGIETLKLPQAVSAKQVEAQVWEKVCQFITNPDYLFAQARALVNQLQTDFNRVQQDELRLREEIRKLATERQRRDIKCF